MEKNSFQLILLVLLALGLLFSQSTAFFSDICAKDCHNRCLSHGSQNVKACTKDCLKTCNSELSLENLNVKSTQYFCNLGCVNSLCSNLNTKEIHPGDEAKLKSCRDYCSKTCTTN